MMDEEFTIELVPNIEEKPDGMNKDLMEPGEIEYIEQTVRCFKEARKALSKITSVEKIIEQRDKTQAFRAYAARRGASLDVINDASTYKLDCERRAGELLASGEVLCGRGRPKANSVLLTLDDLGITKNDSSRWQKESGVDQEIYESWCDECREKQVEITTLGLLKVAKMIQNKRERDRLAAETAARLANFKADDAYIADLADCERLRGQVRTFYSSPPWKYFDESADGPAALQYPTMPIEEICEMGPAIKDLSHPEGAFLWLWTTWPMIRDAVPQRVLKEWGFEWKSEVVWNTMRPGRGRLLLGQTEVCILATRGKPKRLRDDLNGFIEIAAGRHALKPGVMYAAIETFGAGEYLELFHRGERRDGWNVFGNQSGVDIK